MNTIMDKKRWPLYTQIIGLLILLISVITGKLFLLAVLSANTLLFVADWVVQYTVNQKVITKKTKLNIWIDVVCVLLVWASAALFFRDIDKMVYVILSIIIVGYGIQYLIKRKF
ncbi:hypothetical protein [Lentilactobacillus kosonis]|uniref:Uncharacterized protein n=1 Tax=Lentilactobacillus kosonis TaxID=2810561 RepID=A0A401FJY7_9LACO|nr:hypothetical protein [Lentilactobacillus kosonis]GAY72541.1 hypothetical protein NBRC111893_687 [Lentilactobacillus kosonis]